ncbi:MAG TPA: AsmA-like C-terminal region-containing protein [Chitinophagaceae bacterium]
MAITLHTKRKWLKYSLIAIGSILLAWALLLVIAVIYLRSNKEKIIATIRSGISERISGTVTFDDLSIDLFRNFPGISADLRNFHLKDSLYPVHRKELFKAKDVYVGFGLLDLFSKTKSPKYLTVVDGEIHLYTDSTGIKNWDITRHDRTKKEPAQGLTLRRVSFVATNAIFEDPGKHKYYELWFRRMKCRMKSDAEKIHFAMETDALVKNASFNTVMGSYVANKPMIYNWQFDYKRSTRDIIVPKQTLHLNHQPYTVGAHFYFGEDTRFEMTIAIRSIPLTEAASIFPLKTQNKINRFKLSKPLKNLAARLSGPMKYLSFPRAVVSFAVEDATLELSTVQFERCSFNAGFDNAVDSTKSPTDENSVLHFFALKGEWQKNSFACKQASVLNLIHPYLKTDIDFKFKLTQIGEAIATSRLDFNAGEGEALLNWAGPLVAADTSYYLDGRINIHGGDIRYNPRDLNFRNTDISLNFSQGDMIVEKMSTELNTDRINIKGRVNNILNFFNTDSSKADFLWDISTPALDIGRLTSSLHRQATGKKKQGYSFFEKFNRKIDRLFDDCNAYLDIHAQKIVYQKFTATNVKGKVTLKNDMVAIDNFGLQHAGGVVNVTSSLKDNGKNSNLQLQANMQNVNVRDLFKAFNNFGLQSLHSQNINGQFSADISLTSMLDANNNLYKPANRGYVTFRLENGRLQNFQPLMDIHNNFLKDRNLDDVSFADLNDRLDIEGNDVKVNRMEIKSTAVNMYVSGLYSFANNTDLSIQIPLHGQKKNATDVPEKKGNHSKGGISVFLRAKDDKDGKLKIGYDLLGRFRNKEKD